MKRIGITKLGGIEGKLTTCCLVSSFLSVASGNSVYVFDLDSTPNNEAVPTEASMPELYPVHQITLNSQERSQKITRLESFAGSGLGLVLVHTSMQNHLIDTLSGTYICPLPQFGEIRKNVDSTPSITAENGIVMADGDTAVMAGIDISRARSYRALDFRSELEEKGSSSEPQSAGLFLSARGLHKMCTNTLRNVSSLSEIQRDTTEILHKTGAARASSAVRVPFLLSLMKTQENKDANGVLDDEPMEYNGITNLWRAAERSMGLSEKDPVEDGRSPQKASIDGILDAYEKLLDSCAVPKLGEISEYPESDRILSSGLDELRRSLALLETADAAIVGASNILGINPQYF